MTYQYLSHTHCFDQEKPACGLINGRHCCLCDIVVKEEKCYSCQGTKTYSQINASKFQTATESMKDYPCKSCNGTGLKPKEEDKSMGMPSIESKPIKPEEWGLEKGVTYNPLSSPTWEEHEKTEFNKRFDLDNYGDSHIVNQKVFNYFLSRMKAIKEEEYKEGQKNYECQCAAHVEIARLSAFTEIEEVLIKMKAPQNIGLPFSQSDREKYRNKIISSALSSLQKLKEGKE